jgi:hypothetical protein
VPVNVEIVSNRIWIQSNHKIRKLDKRLPGAAWATHPEARWSVPITLEACLILRSIFGRELSIGPELRAWAETEKVRRAHLKKIAEAHDGWPLERLGDLYPKLHDAVTLPAPRGRPYQSSGVAFGTLGRRTILADTVGLGKTFVAMGMAPESGVDGPYFLTAPKTALKPVWGRHIWEWLPDHNVTIMPEGREKREAAIAGFMALAPEERKKAWLVSNPEVFRAKRYWRCTQKQCGVLTRHKKRKSLDCKHDPRKGKLVVEYEFPELFDITWGGMFLDESDRQILVVSSTPNMVRVGLQKVKLRDDALMTLMSATPFRSRPHLLFSSLSLLYPQRYTSLGNWADTFYSFEENDWNPHIHDYRELRPDRERMLYASLDATMIRRTRTEVAKHLPPRNYVGTPYYAGEEHSAIGIWLPLTDRQEKSYRQMERMGIAKLRGGTIDAIGSLAELARMKQFASSAGKLVDQNFHPALPSNKYDYLTDTLLPQLGFPDNPQKLVIVSESTKLLKFFAGQLKRDLGLKCVGVVGGMTERRRNEAIDSFNEQWSEPWIMMLNTKAGGASITLDAADHMVFLDQPPIDDDLEQVEGRIDNRRPELGIRPRFYYHLLSEDTVDVGMAVVNAMNRATGRDILDGRRGVAYVRRVVELSSQQPNR